MEINTQQLEALLHLQEQQAQFTRKNDAEAQGFEALLNQELAAVSKPGPDPAVSAAQATLYNPLLADQAGNATDPDIELMQAAFDQASGALDMWDAYAGTLGTSSSASALKDAYSLLDGIDATLSQLRANPVAGRDESLGGLLNELEILSATERFKFNRGDYLV